MRAVGSWAASAACALALASVASAAEVAMPKGAAVTVLKAGRSCFADTVEAYGFLIPADEVSVRAERPGAKVADVLVEAGDNVAAGQPMARLVYADGTSATLGAPTAGVVASSTAVMGAPASAKGEALFSIVARNAFDLVGLVPVRELARVAVDQPVRIRIPGATEMAGRVRSVAAAVEPATQLGQVTVAVDATRRLLANASAHATITTGESCGVSLPLTAILYGDAGTVVQVVRRQRIETRRVAVGLMAGGRIEIREGLKEGDDVVARAGALLREGDPVRPVAIDAAPKT